MKPLRILIFLISVLMVLAGIAYVYPSDGYDLHGIRLNFPTIDDILYNDNIDTETVEEKLARMEAELRLQFVRDSLNEVRQADIADSLAYIDTLNVYKNFFKNSLARIHFPDNNNSMFDDLFACMDRCSDSVNGEVMHILHYGDSQIEGDRITGYIREYLQRKFGGKGPGMLPAIQPIPSMTVAQSVSDTMSRYIADGNLRQKHDDNHYGILAQMAHLDGDATLNFRIRATNNGYDNLKNFSNISLMVGNIRAPFRATLKYDNVDSTQTIESACSGFNMLSWKTDDPTSKFSMQLSGDAEIYGIVADGSYGVAVDNIPLRGSSGTFFSRIPSDLLKPAMDKLNVGLIILEFGGNATPYINSDTLVMRYKNRISRQIAFLKKTYPRAEILLIGPADMSHKVNGVLQSYSNIEMLTKALKEAALENKAAFWSMYDVMGGKNSMIKWVGHQPPLASTDYIHFTRQGADRIAELFVQTFMVYYDYYQFMKRNQKWHDKKKTTSYECVVDSLNKILFLGDDTSRMNIFLDKFSSAINGNDTTLNIIHFGGSHVQADVFTNRIRHNFNDMKEGLCSGRGMIFPYSTAKTNNPHNYKVGSKGEWRATRNVNEERTDTLGLTGIAVTTNDASAEITIDLNPNDTTKLWRFNRLRLLGYASSPKVSPLLKINDTLCLEADFDTISSSYLFTMEDNHDKFSIIFQQNDSINHDFTVTGILPENDDNGIIYHSIGVNGAEVSSYLSCENFVNDLELIKPDVAVFAIGINDTFAEEYTDSTFIANYDSLISKIEQVSPDCFYIFITNNDSFRKEKIDGQTYYHVNEHGDNAREVFYLLAERHDAAVWDLFGIMGGMESMKQWEEEGLAKKDKIHFTNKGYTLIGDLFFDALIRFYSERI